LGRSIFLVFNESIVGLFGILSVFWGGFKVFVGLIIYVFFLYSLLFHPEYFVPNHPKIQIKRIKQRIKRDIEFGRIDKAINRLHFLVHRYPNKEEFRYELANLYIKIIKPINAVQQLYLLKQHGDIQKNAVEMFRCSVGNNEFQTLRKLFDYKTVDGEFYRRYRYQLLLLLKNIQSEQERNSWLVKAIHSEIKNVDSFIYFYYSRNRSLVINIFFLMILLMVRFVL
jgi:hypothetical protein